MKPERGEPVCGGELHRLITCTIRAAEVEDSATDVSPIERLCVDKGLRMTSQRRIVAKVLSTSRDHPDVEELHRRVRKIDPRIALSTTYRTVRLFCKKGIVETHNLGAGRARLETVVDRNHNYLVDVHSGEVVEFRADAIERLLAETASQLGYRIIRHKLTVYAAPVAKRRGVIRRDDMM